LAAGVDRDGKPTQTGNLTVNARETASLHGHNLASDTLSVEAKNLSLRGSQTEGNDLTLTSATRLNLQDAYLSANKAMTLSAPEWIDNQRGELNAETLVLNSQQLLNNAGRITQTGQHSLRLEHAAGIENNGGTIASSGQDLILKAKTVANQKGTLAHAGTGVFSVDTADFQGKEGRLISDGELELSGGRYQLSRGRVSAQRITADIQSLDHRLGNMIQSGKNPLTLAIQQGLDNRSGTISANGTVDIRADNLANNILTDTELGKDDVLTKAELSHAQGNIVAAEDGRLQINVKNDVNNEAGQLRASDSVTISASSIHNQQGHISSSGGDITLTTGQLNNAAGHVTGAQNLRLTTAAINNEKGQIKAGDVDVNTGNHQLNNIAGQVAAERRMTLQTGELLNQGGLLQSGQALTLNTNGQHLDNRNTHLSGGVFSQGAMNLTVGRLSNQSGHIGSGAELTLTGDTVTNQQGQILGGKNTVLTVAALNNNQGLLQSGGQLTLNAQSVLNRNSGLQQGITSKQAMILNTQMLDNAQGVMVSADRLHIKTAQMNNRQGIMKAQTTLNLVSQGLDNRSGRIESEQALFIDTQGKTLSNVEGKLNSQGRLTVRSGDLDNRRGVLHGQSGIEVGVNQLDNRENGKLLSEADLKLEADNVWNQQGQIVALNHLTMTVNATPTSPDEITFNNRAGLLRSGGNIDLSAHHINNADTRQPDQGMEGRTLTLRGNTLNNTQGQLVATENADLTLQSALNNHQGQMQANQILKARGKALAVINTQGDIKAGQGLVVEADALSGDGKLRSLGDITLNLLKDFIHTGELIANGQLTLTSQGDITNRNTISAATLLGHAVNLTNDATGKIWGQHQQWTVQNTVNNRGLIDGAQTYLKAAQLTNQGTGRLYGDHIALDARKLDNLAEKGKSAVIAARHRLDMGADELNNTTHSLIYSEGDVSIGGQLDSQYRATGKGQVLNNHSANIEAVGNMRLGMEKINNVNDHFSTEMQLISQEPVKEYQVGGTRYPVKDHKITIDNDEVDHACVDDMPCRDNFQVYQYTRTIEESRVKETDPAKMLAGKDLVIETTVLTNDKSQVVAGGGLTVTGGKIDNIDVQGERHVTDKGQIEYFWRIQKKGRDNQGWRSERYEPNPEIHAITLTPGTVEAQQGKVELKGQRPEAYQGEQAHIDAITGSPVNARFANEEVMVSDAVLRAPQRLDIVSAEPTAVGEKPVVIRTEAPHYRLPDNSLFKVNLPLNNTLLTPSPTSEKISGELAQDRPTAPDNPVVPLPEHRGNPFVVPEPDNQVLVETDPQFTQLKKWLGTDYMQQALQTDHNQLHKRLGDGFYEQRLLREQIVNLTGRRYLPGYRNDEEQFKALMNAGLRAQKTFNLVPGIALSAEQMARLTEDMVWLVNTPVTLPDGRQQTVWVPQVYVRTQGGTLDGTGALLSGNQINLQLSGDLLNQGKIVGQDLSLLADNIRNQSGHMQGDNLSLLARTDLVQRGGALRADKSLTMQAGNNVDIASTTRSGENQAGSGRFSSTYVDNVAGIYVQGDDGKLHLQAGNDIHLSAAHLVTQGKRSEIQLDAGRDIQFGTAKTTRYEHTEAGRDHRVTQTTADEVGAVVQGAGQIKMQAERDVQLRAAEVTAGDNLHLGAGRDVTVSAGEQQQTHDEYHKVKGSNSLVSSKTTTTQFQYDRQQARSSTLSGDAVKVEAGNDITVGGSNVVGTQAVTLNAGHNLNITTAREKNHEFYHQEEKKSGLMGTGGIGFTVGSSALKQSTDRDAVQYKGSTVGSSDGSVSLSANHQASVHGSDVVAGKDLDIQGKDVLISAAKNTHTELSKTEQKQSGLTLALSGAVGSALNTAVQTANDAKDTQDSRLKALKGTQAALSGVQGYQAYQLSEANAAKADAINQAGGEAKKPDDTIGIQLSYGSQSSKSDTRVDTTDSQGSHLNAGRDIRITATGDPAEENGGHLHIQGSGLKAGRDVALDAKQDIVLESAENTQTTRGKNSSQGGSVGVGLTAGQGGYGIKFSASVNKGKGHETGDGVTHTETLIDAGNQVSLKAGQDTTLKGAQVSGDKVTADVGRHLHLQSEQDKDNYDAKQENVSAGASFTYGSMSGSASVNASRDKIHSQFESVNEQTGIFAGKGGFDIKVGEHTQLDGAVIASTADKEKNSLETGTLGFSDIENKAEYQSEHQSVGISTGGAVGSQLASNMASNMLAGSNKSDSKSSTTHAAVSDGTLIVRDADKQQQDISALSRDTDNAANSLSPIFDKEKEQRRLAQAQAIAQIGTQVLDIYSTHEAIKATKTATEKLKDPQAQQALKQQAEAQLKQENGDITAESIAGRAHKIAYDAALKAQGAEIGGGQRQAVTAVVTALQGLAGGDVKAAIAGGAAPYLANAVKELTYGGKPYDQLTDGEKATNLLAHAILGGVIAEMKGGSATAGAVGAASGELAASAIAGVLYGGKTMDELSPDEKEKVSNLSTIAGGLAAGLTTDSTAGGVSGAQTAKNAVENNFLHADQIDDFAARAKGCEARGDCQQINQEMRDLSLKQQEEMIAVCASNPAACKEKYGDIPANGLLVRQAIDRVLGDDVPSRMKNDMSSLLAQQIEAEGVVSSTEFAHQLISRYGIDKQQAEILAGAALGAVTGGMGSSKGNKPSSSNAVKDNKSANSSTGQQVNTVNSDPKVPQGNANAGKGTQTEATKTSHSQIGNAEKGTTGNISTFNPNEIRFSQNTVSYNKTERGSGVKYSYDDLVSGMKKDGWKGDPVDVVKMPDGKFTSMDNTRITAAREAGIDIKANVRNFDDKLTPTETIRFSDPRRGLEPKTWGEAITGRINKQTGGFSKKNPYGSDESPRITGKSKD
ncbi:hemagglutinin repeat-containing protein, partial [Xenorhabdus szentirmaii]|uniref:hemagglutinin repeat-containing protein n=1 Tax=Xenorhabdus szentirmaii TaxID=290112 RepID=UPI0019849F93